MGKSTTSTVYTLAQIHLMKFKPKANANGTGTFTFQVQDNGGTANGGKDIDAASKTITVNVS